MRLLFVLGVIIIIICWPVIRTSEALLEREPNAHTRTHTQHTRTARVVWWWWWQCARVCRQQEPRLCIEREIDVSVCLCDVEHIYIYMKHKQTRIHWCVLLACWLVGWLVGSGGWYATPPPPPPNQASEQHTLNGIAHYYCNSSLRVCVCAQRTHTHTHTNTQNGGYLVDPASSHMLVSKIKPCMSKYKLVYTARLRMAH